MNREKLYEVASEFKETKLWDKLRPNQIFAFRRFGNEEDEDIYVSVTGHRAGRKSGGFVTLRLFIGEESEQILRDLCSDPQPHAVEFPEFGMELRLNCLMAQFAEMKNLTSMEKDEIKAFTKAHGIQINRGEKYPQFIRYKRSYLPGTVNEPKDVEALYRGLKIAVKISQLLKDKTPEGAGFVTVALEDRDENVYETESFEVPRFTIDKDDNLAPDGKSWLIPKWPNAFAEYVYKEDLPEQFIYLTELPRKGRWDMHFVRMMETVQDCLGEAYYPLHLIFVEEKTNFCCQIRVNAQGDDSSKQIWNAFAELWGSMGFLPEKVYFKDERGYAILERLCWLLKCVDR